MNGGRPLRFLAILLSGWATARGIDIYNGDGPELPAWVAPVARAVASLVTSPAAATPLAGPHPATRRTVATVPSRDTADRRTVPAARLRAFAAPSVATASDGDGASPQRPVVPLLSPAVLPPTIAHAGSRLAGSAWLIARNGSAPGVPGSQLGASQAGARITYALGGSRRVRWPRGFRHPCQAGAWKRRSDSTGSRSARRSMSSPSTASHWMAGAAAR